MMIELARRSLHRLPDAAGLHIRCHSGTVWLTLDHDSRDIVLEAGDSFATPEHRRGLIFALEPARVHIDPPARGRPAARGTPLRVVPWTAAVA